ncbi:glycosyltransferase family 2 protein [Mangrovimonas sp. CR14]|uniref:glycosyltransferase family 2 protein n=1 Tax=Mangrovimonas sp. CR14 TaxID=2706120 RepID=UPI00141F3A98|nr:glycosyltransferase family 2 protein [Mangrovimonas sp. CR14]NIK92523.1 glycosyltransferase family 2 protein [Mangrovimonas sp. CR14]
MDKPLVSICIPTYNGARYIAEALESALTQTYPYTEIVISDDASSDATLDIIKRYQLKTAIPIHIYPHEPSGIGANWNHCIKQANGIYIKFLFQDDVLNPTCISEMVDLLEHDKKVGLVACKRDILVDKTYRNDETEQWIETYGDLQDHLNIPVIDGVQYLDRSVFKSRLLLIEPLNKIGEPTVFLFRKQIVDDIGFFREDLFQILDFEFCNRVLRKYKIAVLNKKLVGFRLHSNQATNSNMTHVKSDLLKYHTIIYEKYFFLINRNLQLKLLKKYNPLFKQLVKIKRIFK